MNPPLPYAIAQAVCEQLTVHGASAHVLCGPHGEGAMVLLDPIILVPDPPAVRFLAPRAYSSRNRPWARLDLGDGMDRLPEAVVEILAHHRTALQGV